MKNILPTGISKNNRISVGIDFKAYEKGLSPEALKRQRLDQELKNKGGQKCAWCDGTGNRALSASYIISCAVCTGKGIIITPEPATHCHKCMGTGRRNQFDSCLTCTGSGWIRVFGLA